MTASLSSKIALWKFMIDSDIRPIMWIGDIPILPTGINLTLGYHTPTYLKFPPTFNVQDSQAINNIFSSLCINAIYLTPSYSGQLLYRVIFFDNDDYIVFRQYLVSAGLNVDAEYFEVDDLIRIFS